MAKEKNLMDSGDISQSGASADGYIKTLFIRLVKIVKCIYIMLGFISFVLIVLSLVFGALYVIKSLLGIDIFPGGHFWEVL